MRRTIIALWLVLAGVMAAHGQSVCSQLPREPALVAPPAGVYRGESPEQYLWPANGPRDMAPGAVRSTSAGFGAGLDRGALRRLPGGTWEYLEFGPQWLPWQPSIHSQLVAASAFRRYGPGWSYGPSWGGHTEHVGYADELCSIQLGPEDMTTLDLEHSNLLFNRLKSEWLAKFGQAPPPGPATPPTPPGPTASPATPAPTPPPVAPPTTPPQGPSLADLRADVAALKVELDGLQKAVGAIQAATAEATAAERRWWKERIAAEVARRKAVGQARNARELEALAGERPMEEP